QRKVFLALMRRPHIAADRIARLEVELAYLRWRDINVIRAGEVVVIGRPQKSVTIGQNLQHAFSEDVPFLLTLRLQNLEDQVLLSQTTGAGNVKATRKLTKLGNIVFF